MQVILKFWKNLFWKKKNYLRQSSSSSFSWQSGTPSHWLSAGMHVLSLHWNSSSVQTESEKVDFKNSITHYTDLNLDIYLMFLLNRGQEMRISSFAPLHFSLNFFWDLTQPVFKYSSWKIYCFHQTSAKHFTKVNEWGVSCGYEWRYKIIRASPATITPNFSQSFALFCVCFSDFSCASYQMIKDGKNICLCFYSCSFTVSPVVVVGNFEKSFQIEFPERSISCNLTPVQHQKKPLFIHMIFIYISHGFVSACRLFHARFLKKQFRVNWTTASPSSKGICTTSCYARAPAAIPQHSNRIFLSPLKTISSGDSLSR